MTSVVHVLLRNTQEQASEAAKRKIDLTAYRNERNLMLYPFCSTSKRKRLNTIEYKSGDGRRWLEVSANHKFGMAKIWDFDILRYALSKAGEIKYAFGHFPNQVQFSGYECLIALRKDPRAGQNHIWLREALARLVSTTYRGNIFRDDSNEVGFTLIGYELVDGKGGVERIKIIFNERLLESVKMTNSLLEVNKDVMLEDSGIKKRLLELVQVSKGERQEWSVRVLLLKEMCAHEGRLNNFKAQLKELGLPWEVTFSTTVTQEEKVTFSGGASKAKG